MKISSYISRKSVSLSFGILMGLLVLTQAVFVPSSVQDQQEQSSENEQTDKQQITPSVAVPSPTAQINLDYQSYLLGEIFQVEKTDLKSQASRWVILPTKKALKVLFRKIISPNAP